MRTLLGQLRALMERIDAASPIEVLTAGIVFVAGAVVLHSLVEPAAHERGNRYWAHRDDAAQPEPVGSHCAVCRVPAYVASSEQTFPDDPSRYCRRCAIVVLEVRVLYKQQKRAAGDVG